jgi:tRNA1(Val) A37 N6-methylase TrmN6
MMILIEGAKDGKAEVRTLKPFIVYNEQNEYCKELMEIYYGGQISSKEGLSP